MMRPVTLNMLTASLLKKTSEESVSAEPMKHYIAWLLSIHYAFMV